jgi:dihydroflavonol-4-reductase
VTENPPFQRAFVTGATGFVGSNLVRLLLKRGVAVRALVRRGANRSNLEGLHVEICVGDLLDESALRTGLRDCDACFHLAAALPGKEARELFRTNVEGTRAALQAAVEAGCPTIVHTSTMGTLSREDGAPPRETDRRITLGASDYVRSKYAAEDVALELAAQGGPIRIVHPSAPVGAWDHVPTVSGRRILDVLEGRAPAWPTGRINHVYVGDVVAGMVLAATHGKPGEHYLLANREGSLTRQQFVGLVARAAGIRPPRTARRLAFLHWLRRARGNLNGGAGRVASLACDPTWTIERLGLPQTPLDRAFAEAVAWYRARK